MEKTKTTKFLGSFSLSKNGGSAGGTANYDDLTNKPKVNGIVLSGNKTSADLGITTLTPFPSTWPTTGKFEDLLAAIRVDTIAVKGASFLGEVTFDDLPANLGNAEIKVEILEGTTSATKVIHSVITSGNREPYRWEYTSWNSGNSNSGWISFQLPLTAGDGISIENNVISATGGNVYTQNNLLAGKGIEIVDEPIQDDLDENTLACFHFDGDALNCSQYATGDIYSQTDLRTDSNVAYIDGKFGKGISAAKDFNVNNHFIENNVYFPKYDEITLEYWLKVNNLSSGAFPGVNLYGMADSSAGGWTSVHVSYNRGWNITINLPQKSGLTAALSQEIINTLDESGWNHIALCCKKGQFIKAYVNGILAYTNTEYTTLSPYEGTNDGIISIPLGSVGRGIDEVRYSKVLRYTGDRFTPQTKPFSKPVPTGNKVINNTITKTSQLTNDSGFLNGLPDNIVTTDTEQGITGRKVFYNAAIQERLKTADGTSLFYIDYLDNKTYVGSCQGSVGPSLYLAGTNTPTIKRYDNGIKEYTNIDSGNISSYLPKASNATLGAVKVDGTTITADSNGVISAAIPTNTVTSDDVTKIKKVTQAEYDSLTPKDENTLYYIIG